MTGHGHRWSTWTYDRHRRCWTQRCTVGDGNCTALRTAPRGHKPTTGRTTR